MGSRPLSHGNVRAFLSRPWARLAELKRDHWAEAFEADPLAAFFLSEALSEVLHEKGHTTDEKGQTSGITP